MSIKSNMKPKTKADAPLVGVVDDGTREIPLKNKFGKLICKIYMRPADLSILDRYDQLTSDLEGLVAPLKALDLKSDGTPSFEDGWGAVKQAENELKRRINAVFDMDEADEIFAKRNPFSSVGGRYFCENVIEALGNIIIEATNAEMQKSSARMAEYLDDLEPKKSEGNADVGTAPADA